MIAVAHRTPLSAAACAGLHNAGATHFELDVQLTGRGLVVSHYFALSPVTPWLEHDRWKLRRPRDLAQDPLFADVVAVVPPTATILIDPKPARADTTRELCTRILHDVVAVDRCVVSTERDDDLTAFASAGFATWRTARSRAALQRLLTEPFRYDGVSVRHTLLSPATCDRLRGLTPTVVAWTVNRTARAQQLLDVGITGITTDNVRVLSLVRDRDRAAGG